MIDPLAMLFQLILQKASSLPVYAPMAVAEFYERLGKHTQAFEVYTAALKKVEHLEVAIKYRVHRCLGDCHFARDDWERARTSFKAAYDGFRALYGDHNSQTMHSLF